MGNNNSIYGIFKTYAPVKLNSGLNFPGYHSYCVVLKDDFKSDTLETVEMKNYLREEDFKIFLHQCQEMNHHDPYNGPGVRYVPVYLGDYKFRLKVDGVSFTHHQGPPWRLYVKAYDNGSWVNNDRVEVSFISETRFLTVSRDADFYCDDSYYKEGYDFKVLYPLSNEITTESKYVGWGKYVGAKSNTMIIREWRFDMTNHKRTYIKSTFVDYDQQGTKFEEKFLENNPTKLTPSRDEVDSYVSKKQEELDRAEEESKKIKQQEEAEIKAKLAEKGKIKEQTHLPNRVVELDYNGKKAFLIGETHSHTIEGYSEELIKILDKLESTVLLAERAVIFKDANSRTHSMTGMPNIGSTIIEIPDINIREFGLFHRMWKDDDYNYLPIRLNVHWDLIKNLLIKFYTAFTQDTVDLNLNFDSDYRFYHGALQDFKTYIERMNEIDAVMPGFKQKLISTVKDYIQVINKAEIDSLINLTKYKGGLLDIGYYISLNYFTKVMNKNVICVGGTAHMVNLQRLINNAGLIPQNAQSMEEDRKTNKTLKTPQSIKQLFEFISPIIKGTLEYAGVSGGYLPNIYVILIVLVLFVIIVLYLYNQNKRLPIGDCSISIEPRLVDVCAG